MPFSGPRDDVERFVVSGDRDTIESAAIALLAYQFYKDAPSAFPEAARVQQAYRQARAFYSCSRYVLEADRARVELAARILRHADEPHHAGVIAHQQDVCDRAESEESARLEHFVSLGWSK